jgi:hypothetical protein
VTEQGPYQGAGRIKVGQVGEREAPEAGDRRIWVAGDGYSEAVGAALKGSGHAAL